MSLRSVASTSADRYTMNNRSRKSSISSLSSMRPFMKRSPSVTQQSEKCPFCERNFGFKGEIFIAFISQVDTNWFLSLQPTIDTLSGARRKLSSNRAPILHPCQQRKKEWKHESIIKRRTWGKWWFISVIGHEWSCVFVSIINQTFEDSWAFHD